MVLSDNTKRIAELNDRLRRFGSGGEIMMTQGVKALPPTAIMKAVAAMRSFTDFSEDNNPYQERDFGKFDADGHEFFFKIDYYDLSLEGGSEEPWNPEKTRRVLTLMLVEEY